MSFDVIVLDSNDRCLLRRSHKLLLAAIMWPLTCLDLNIIRVSQPEKGKMNNRSVSYLRYVHM